MKEESLERYVSNYAHLAANKDGKFDKILGGPSPLFTSDEMLALVRKQPMLAKNILYEADKFAALVNAEIPAASKQELMRLGSMEDELAATEYNHAVSTLSTVMFHAGAARKLFKAGATVDDIYALDRTGLQGTFSGALNVALEKADAIAAAVRRMEVEAADVAGQNACFRKAVSQVLCAEYPQSREHIEKALSISKTQQHLA